jgi:hypothetical protein
LAATGVGTQGERLLEDCLACRPPEDAPVAASLSGEQMSYEKKPDFFCKECHKSFKNQRALDAHNEAKHSEPEDRHHRTRDEVFERFKKNIAADKT